MINKYMHEDNREEMKRNHKEIVDFLSNGNNHQDEALPNYNYGREKLPPPNPTKPPQAEFKEPSVFSEYEDEKDDEVYINPPAGEAPSLSSDVLPANKRYSEWTCINTITAGKHKQRIIYYNKRTKTRTTTKCRRKQTENEKRTYKWFKYI